MKHTNTRLGQRFIVNGSIESNCSDISFINEGTTAATIFCGDSKNGRTLQPDEAVDYNNEIGGTEITAFRVTFVTGSGVLYVEKSYKKTDDCK